MLAGGLLGGLLTIALAFAAEKGAAGVGMAVRGFLVSGGWWIALLGGAGLGALGAVRWARTGRERLTSAVVALSMLVLAGVVRIEALGSIEGRPPATPRAKARSILRWSYQSPRTVAWILPYARDPDPTVREQAVLALGVNLIVSDVERATPRWPSRYAHHVLRERLRDALLVALADSVETIRAQAARALWKAPHTFGSQPAAAETLSAMLDRVQRPGAVERLAWLALDAAAGVPHPALQAAAARFAVATSDSGLAVAARRAAGLSSVRR
jgi:hypothetical protein